MTIGISPSLRCVCEETSRYYKKLQPLLYKMQINYILINYTNVTIRPWDKNLSAGAIIAEMVCFASY